MSHFPLTAGHSPTPSLPDLAALAEKLQETAQALLAVCQQSDENDVSGGSELPSASSIGGSAPPFAVRSYRIPDHILRDECELLEETGSDDLKDALNKVYEHFFCIV